MLVDDLVRQGVDLLIGHSQHSCPENMVVVLAVVETDQPILCQPFDLRRARVDHPVDFILLGKLPVYKQ